MNNGILLKTLLGDSIFILSDLSGQLLSPCGQVLLSGVPILGIQDETSLEQLCSLPSEFLKTRFRFTTHNNKPVIFYNEGLKGGGANQSCCGSKPHKRNLKSSQRTMETYESTVRSAVTLETIILSPRIERSELFDESAHLLISYFDYKQYRNIQNKHQERYLRNLENSLKAAHLGAREDSKIFELINIHPSELSDSWLAVIGLLYILIQDGAWKDGWYRIRYELGKLSRRLALSFFVNQTPDIDTKQVCSSIIQLALHVKLRAEKNDSRIVENGLKCEMEALEQILKNFHLRESWHSDFQHQTSMLCQSYTSRSSQIVISKLMKQYHEMSSNDKFYLLASLIVMDVVDLDVKKPNNFEECFEEIFNSVYDKGWSSLYHALSLLESGITTGRCTQPFLSSFLEVKSKVLCNHGNWRVREKTIAIILILLRHRDVLVRQAAQKVYISVKKHEKKGQIKYLLNQKEVIYLHTSYVHREVCKTVLKESVINIDTLTPNFFGRKQEIKLIANTLRSELSHSIITIYGQEGIGKSSLAECYASSYADKYDIIWRINAKTSTSIKQSFKDLAFRLNIEHIDIYTTMREINLTLSSSAYKTLLIFDNIEDYEMTSAFIPDEGHIILTTRHSETAGVQLEIKELDIQSSVRLLSKLISAKADEQIAEATRCLGYNPRNLILAAFNISYNSMKIQDFIDSSNIQNLLQVNLNVLDEKVKFLIDVLSMFDSEDIPFDGLYEIYKCSYPEDSILDLKQSMMGLINFKIIEHHFYSDTIRIQRLVYDSVRNHYTYNDTLSQRIFNYFINHLDYDYNRSQDYTYSNSYRHYAPHIEAYLHINDPIPHRNEFYLRGKISVIYYYCLGDSSSTSVHLSKLEDLLQYIDCDDPELSRIFISVASIYYSLEQFNHAEEHYVRSKEIRDQILDSSLAECYDNLGKMSIMKDRYNKAKKYYEISRRIYEDQLPYAVNKLAETYDILGGIYKEKADRKIRNKIFAQFEEFKQNPIIDEHANSCISIGNMHFANGDYKAAESFYTECKVLYNQKLPPDHPDIASINTNLGCIYDSIGNYDLAKDYYRQAIKIYTKVLQPNHPYLATIYNNLGCLYFSKKDYPNAEKYFIKCKNIREEMYLSYQETSKLVSSYERAEEYYVRSLRLYETSASCENIDLACIYSNLGDVQYSKKEYDKAIKAYKTSKKIKETILPKKELEIAELYDKLAKMYELKGDLQQAKESYKNSIKIRISLSGSDHLELAVAYNLLASILSEEKDYKTAQTLYDRSYKITSELINNDARQKPKSGYSLRSLEKLSKYKTLDLNDTYASLASVYLNLGSVYYSQQDYITAEEFYTKHLDLYRQYAPLELSQHAKAYNNLGNLYYEQDNFYKAEEFYMECLRIYEQDENSYQSINLASLYNNLGSLFFSQGDTDKAQEFYLKSQAIREKVLPDDHKDLISVRENLDLISPREIIDNTIT